jgi:hypothetical protein
MDMNDLITQLYISSEPDELTQQAIDRLKEEAVKRGYRTIHTHAEIYNTTQPSEIELIKNLTPDEYVLEFVEEHFAPLETQHQPWIQEIAEDITLDQAIIYQHVHIVTNDGTGTPFTAVYKVLRNSSSDAIE